MGQNLRVLWRVSQPLGVEMTAAAGRGLQGDDLGQPGAMLACAKHFVGDGGATWGNGEFGFITESLVSLIAATQLSMKRPHPADNAFGALIGNDREVDILHGRLPLPDGFL